MGKIINNNKVFNLIALCIVGLYMHLTIGDKIAASLIYIWHLLLVALSIFAVMGILFAIRVLATKWQKLASEAQKSIAESEKHSRDVREFDRGKQIYQFGLKTNETVHALHLDPATYSNGVFEQPSNQQLEIYNQYTRTFNQQNNYYGQDNAEINNDGVPLLMPLPDDSQSWIDELLEAPHLHLIGETGSGKTTFAQLLIDKLLQTEKGADFWLVSPKHVEYKKTWPIEPCAKNVDTSLTMLMKLSEMMNDRKDNPDYNPDKDSNQVVIVDDWDYIYQIHRREAISPLVILLKIGRELNFKVILIGQSVLSNDTGLSRSDYNNMVSSTFGREAYQTLKMLPLTVTEKHSYREQLATSKKNRQRRALIVSHYRQPEVRSIPDLKYYTSNRRETLLSAPKTATQTVNSKELTVIEMLEKGKSLRECARFLTDKPQELINSSDTDKIKKIAQKHNINV